MGMQDVDWEREKLILRVAEKVGASKLGIVR